MSEQSDVQALGPAAPPVTLVPAGPAGVRSEAAQNAPVTKVHAADGDEGSDALGRTSALDGLADLCAHRGAETPIAIALLGSAGAGKSHALRAILTRVAALSAAAKDAGRGPFLPTVLTVRLDAARAAGAPAVALAHAFYEKLIGGGLETGRIAQEAARSLRDANAIAQEARERLERTRLRLIAERKALAEVEARRARLPEIILFETPGAAVDHYARTNKALIEERLAAFGFATSDPVATYKSLVRDIVERGGRWPAGGAFLRSTWAFGSQARLLRWALILLGIEWGLGKLWQTQDTWLPWLRGISEQMQPAADWIAQHTDWLPSMQGAALGGAIALLLLDLWRALRFARPLLTGVNHMTRETATRAGQLDAAAADHAQRIESFRRDAEQQVKQVQAAASKPGPADGASNPFALKLDDRIDPIAAGAFIEAVDRLVAQAAPGGVDRIVCALDNLDALAPDRAADVATTVRTLLTGRSFALLMALDETRFAARDACSAGLLARLAPLSFRLTAPAASYGRLVLDMLGERRSGAPREAAEMQASVLDRPMTVMEAQVLVELAPLAGQSPRSVKRFVNSYRLVRTQGEPLAPLALVLATDASGDELAWKSLVKATAGGGDFAPPSPSPAFAVAIERTRAANGGSLTSADMADALRIAGPYCLQTPADVPVLI